MVLIEEANVVRYNNNYNVVLAILKRSLFRLGSSYYILRVLVTPYSVAKRKTRQLFVLCGMEINYVRCL